MSERACASCGMSLEAVHKNGTIGCVHCVREFRSEILLQFRRSGHLFTYSGKMPPSGGGSESLRLRTELYAAVQGDDFEKAAALREMLGKNKSGGTP